MVEVDGDLERSLEQPVKEFLLKGLSGAKPALSTRAFCAEARLNRQRSLIPRHRVAVALVLACAIFILFRIPLVSRAFASVPLLGDAYVSFLRQVNLDAAYRAGLLTRLDRTLTKNGLTMTVIDAGVDGDEIVVSFAISPAEEDPEGIWARQDRGEIMFSVGIAGSENSWSVQTQDSETDRVYGMVRVERPSGLRSLLWHLVGGRISLSLEAREREPAFDPPFDEEIWKAGRVLYTWEMSLPVRAVEVEPTVVTINKEVSAGKDIITLDRLVLTPWRTVVEYSIRNAEPGDTPNRQHWRLLGNCISITTSDGRSFSFPGGSAPEDWGVEAVGHGEAHFEAISGQEASIVFRVPRYEEATLRLPLEENASVSCLDGGGTLRVDAVKRLEGGLEVTIRLESELTLHYAGVQLVDGQGRPMKRGPFERYGRYGLDNSVTVPFVTDLDSGPYHLEVDPLFAVEPQGTVVFEVKVSADLTPGR